MKNGNWIPLSKSLSKALPYDRAYTKLEAAFSLQLDYDAGKHITVSGYAGLWKWSRGKVERFLTELGVTISYPELTTKKQNQNGQIMIQISSRYRAESRQIRLIDSKWLEGDTDRRRADNEQKTSRSQSTTIDPNPNPDPDTNIPPIVPHGGNGSVLKCFPYPDWLNNSLWADFHRMRSRIKKPITTERTISGLINKLESLINAGHDQDKLIQNAIDNCWKSFYPPKQEQLNHSTGCRRTDNNLRAAEDFINDDSIG